METLLKEYGFPGVKKPRGMGLARPPRPSLPSPSACFEIILIFFAGICRWICNSQVPDFLQTGRARSDLEQKAGFGSIPSPCSQPHTWGTHRYLSRSGSTNCGQDLGQTPPIQHHTPPPMGCMSHGTKTGGLSAPSDLLATRSRASFADPGASRTSSSSPPSSSRGSASTWVNSCSIPLAASSRRETIPELHVLLGAG